MKKNINSILSVPLNNSEVISNLSFLKKELSKKKLAKSKLKLAILGGSSTQHIRDLVDIFLLKENINVEIYEGQFNSYFEEIFFDINKLVLFKPDIIWIHSTWRNIKIYPDANSTNSEVEQMIEDEFNFYLSIWKKAYEKFNCTIYQNNFDFPNFRVLANKESIDFRGKINFLNIINSKFSAFDRKNNWFHVFDINFLSSQEGLNTWQNERDWYQYSYSPSINSNVHLCYNFSRLILSYLGLSKKCIVLDLDDTLWGGVIGDDGVKNIVLGQENALGRAFTDFQKYILELKKRGILAAIISKNEEKFAKLGFEHESSILKLGDFSVIIANWDNKYLNMNEVIKKLNIGEDSAVFIDNNPVERDEMARHSNVSVPFIGEDITRFRNLIEQNNYFEFENLTDEDLKRSERIKASIKSKNSSSGFKSYFDYLMSLNMSSLIEIVTDDTIERTVQLVNKTNQFNTTQERISTTSLAKAMRENKDIILTGSLSDKFTDHGIVSVLYGEVRNDIQIDIKVWVMSCRVFSRTLENAMFEVFLNRCKKSGIKKITAMYRHTEKNENYANLYKNLGFNLKDQNKMDLSWELDLNSEIKLKKHAITLNNE